MESVVVNNIEPNDVIVVVEDVEGVGAKTTNSPTLSISDDKITKVQDSPTLSISDDKITKVQDLLSDFFVRRKVRHLVRSK